MAHTTHKHDLALNEIVGRLSPHYDFVASNVLYGKKSRPGGEIDVLALRCGRNGVLLNLYEYKCGGGRRSVAVGQLERALDYFVSLHALPVFVQEMLVSWSGGAFRINCCYVHEGLRVERVHAFKWYGPRHLYGKKEYGGVVGDEVLHDVSGRHG
jgi:hypothetical protein